MDRTHLSQASPDPSVAEDPALSGFRWGLERNLMLNQSWSQLRQKQYSVVRFKLPDEKLPAEERRKQFFKLVPFLMWDEMLISACMPHAKAWVKQQVREGRYVFFPVCFCDILLRGVSQVYLMDHPIAGLFILAAVSLTKTIYIYAALLGTLASTLGAIYGLRGFTDSIFDGLYGYDGCLVGMAVFTFFYEAGDVWQMTLTTLALGFFAGIFQVALVYMFKRLKVPALTISFNLVTIMFLGSTSSKINAVATLRSGGPASAPIEGPPLFTVVLEGTVKGIGQFMFADTMVGGLLIFLAIMMCKRIDSAGALLGSFVATVTAAYIHRVSPGIMPAVQNGLWSYNGMGCGAAFASGLFTHPTGYNFLFGMTSAALSVLSVGAWVAWLTPLPVLTLPFVSTVMVTLMARHHGEEVQARRALQVMLAHTALLHRYFTKYLQWLLDNRRDRALGTGAQLRERARTDKSREDHEPCEVEVSAPPLHLPTASPAHMMSSEVPPSDP